MRMSYAWFSTIFLIVSGCKEDKQMQMPLQMVGASKALKENVPLVLEIPAKITGSLEVQVRSQANGILKKRIYQEGEYVKEGVPLFEIDPTPYKASVTKAEGTFAQAESEMRRATREYNRMKKLYSDKSVSQKEHDESLSCFERAQANLKVAEGLLNEAKINLGYTIVKSPISGIVRKEAQSIGNLISSSGESGLLTSMIQVCPLHAIFSVPGSTWANIMKSSRDGKVTLLKFDDYKVEIVLPDGSLYPETGKIIFVDVREDDLTSSVSVKAEIPNNDQQKILLPGQFVRVRIVGAEYKDAIVVPSAALISTQLGMVVYVVRDDKVVEVRPVKSEIVNNKAIIHSGLNEGEVIISEGIIKARPGLQINAVLKMPTVNR